MKIDLEKPYSEKWRLGYIVVNSENRKNVILFNNSKDRSTVSYARYLMAVHLGRFLDANEQVDHIDEDKTNDSIENLQILSCAENLRKNAKHRVRGRVEKHGTLTEYRYCKCDLCREAHRIWHREYTRKRREAKRSAISSTG